jgi:4'-phosphopantetheinyl transferase
LDRDQVHIWQAHLETSSSRIDEYFNTLAEEEKSRAARLYFQRDRDRFIIAHGILRAILGLYLNRAPHALSFNHGSQGKPTLELEPEVDDVRFNLSHSRAVALYAIARGREVGIDVEFVRPEVETDQIADRFFSSTEIASLRALPRNSRKNAFFLCWTRKEAYIKARGEGLSLPLDRFDVSLIPGDSAALLRTRPDPDEAGRWSLRELPLTSGYAAALAVEGRGWSLSCWQWPHLQANQPHFEAALADSIVERP